MDQPIPARGRRQGGGERGKLGPRDSIPYQSANRLPVSNQRLLEILDDRHLLGGSRLEASFPEETQGARTQLARAETEAGTAEGRRCTAPGESAPVKLLVAELLRWVRHRRQAKLSLRFCGKPENEPHATQGPLPIEQLGA